MLCTQRKPHVLQQDRKWLFIVQRLKLNFPSLCLTMSLFKYHMIVKPLNTGDAFSSRFRWLSKFTTGIFKNQGAATFYHHFLPGNTFVKLQVLKTAFHTPPTQKKSCSTAWGKLAHGHRNRYGCVLIPTICWVTTSPQSWKQQQRASAFKTPISLFETLPLFLGPFPATSGLLVHSKREKHTGGGWGRRAPTCSCRSARRRSTGEGSFWRKWLLREDEEGQSCKRIKFQQTVRSSQRLMLVGTLVTSDCFIMDFHPDSASAQEVDTSVWVPNAAEG